MDGFYLFYGIVNYYFGSAINKTNMDNKEEVVYAIIDKIIGRTGKSILFVPSASYSSVLLAFRI